MEGIFSGLRVEGSTFLRLRRLRVQLGVRIEGFKVQACHRFGI